MISSLSTRYPYLPQSTLSNRAQTQTRSSFSDAASAISGGTIHVRLPGPNCLYSGGDGKGQSMYIEYAENSSEEDPVVHISGNSLSGAYEKTVHINDINPASASAPELCALTQHLYKTGQSSVGWLTGRPMDMNLGDYSRPQNFTQKLQNCITKNQRYNSHMAQAGKNLLSVFEDFLAQKSRKEKLVREDERIDVLLDYIGRARAADESLVNRVG